MKLQFLDLPINERKLYFDQASAQGNVSPVLLEKDFWVSWLLAVLYSSPFAKWLVFKGGTSLSKVFGAIDRFSEDIDLSLAPEFLELPEAGSSKNQSHKWMEQAEAACSVAVEQKIAPVLEKAVSAFLGENPTGWFEYLTDPGTHSPVLLFHYPTTQPPGFDYLRRSVKLEFGSLTDQQPTGRHPIQPLMASLIPATLPDWTCDVVALELERTFWEKATILHTEYHRPADKQTPDRYSRHYADTASLALMPIADHAISQPQLRERVVNWKSRFFGSGWAHYDLAIPGAFRLVPPEARLAPLRSDYDAMRDMYMSPPRSFDDVIATLTDLETRINQGG